MMESVLCLYVTEHAKTAHVDTQTTPCPSDGIETQYFHSVTTMPNKFLSRAENFIVVECGDNKL